MPGLFGVIQLAPDEAQMDAARLAAQMERRLTLGPGQRVDRRSEPGASLGRYGAPFHHGTPWSEDVSTAVVAGLPDAASRAPLRAAAVAPEALRNPFAVALRHEGGWLLAVDRYASIPLYFAKVGTRLLFASEVKALLANPGLAREPDEEAMATFLACGHLVSDQTLFGAVRRLRGGHMLEVSSQGEVSVAPYWRFRPGARAGEVDPKELERRIGDGLAGATARCLRDPDRTVVLLSGGMDSRSLLCAALECHPAERVQAVTFAGEGGDNSDVEAAVQVAKAAGIRHRVIQRQLGNYAADFAEMNAVIDGLSTIAIYSPNSYRQYRQLAETGIETVLRGDEPLSYGSHVESYAEAALAVGLRRIDEVHGLADLIVPERRERMRAASDLAFAAMLREVEDLSLGQAREALGVSHRQQTFLANSAAYKAVHLLHRAPLLDDDIIDLMEFFSDEERADKALFWRAMRNRYPRLFGMDFAKRWSTLDDWAGVLSGPTPARRYALGQLQDAQSSFWETIDLAAALALLDRIGPDARAANAPVRSRVRAVLRRLRGPLLSALGRQVRRAAQPAHRPRPHVLLLRVLALKQWHDVLRTASPASF